MVNLESQERRVFWVVLVSEVCLERMERLVLLDLLGPLDLLEKEESKDNLGHLVSRVCLDLLDPQEREESLVTWVFLERVELLALQDPEVSVDSLARGAVPDLRVSRDLADFRERQEPTDPRELSDQLALREHRAHQASRACQEREELVESPGPRETGATMERRDLKELLERTVLEV